MPQNLRVSGIKAPCDGWFSQHNFSSSAGGSFSKSAEQPRTVFQRQSLGAYGRFHFCAEHGPLEIFRRVSDFKVVPQRLTFLRKRELEKADEFVFVNSELFKMRRNREPHDSRMHFWWWRERNRRHDKELLNPRIELRGRRKQTIFLAAR